MQQYGKINLTNSFKISRIVHGHWHLADWSLSNQELLTLTHQCIELGVTTFDHADIYGNYSCETLFGNALHLDKSLRKNIQIITKCGIKLKSDKFPERTIKSYDYSYHHIVSSVENSLKNLNTNYIDVLLLHRPSPFFNPEEVVKAFEHLQKSGKILHFGVSNFSNEEVTLLNSYFNNQLVTNQIEISPYCIDSFEKQTITYLQTHQIKPMAWSPLAGGYLLNPTDEKGNHILNSLEKVAKELEVEKLDIVIYSWLLSHPASIIPIVGSGKIDRIKNAVDALKIKLSTEQWLKIYIAATGKELP